jgi:DNA-binding NarL/FixJ family response regulator
VLSPALAGRVLTEFARAEPMPATADEPEMPTLTARQREVLELAAQGLTNKEIAEQLCVSVETVKSHISQILKRLQVHSRHELARYTQKQDPS